MHRLLALSIALGWPLAAPGQGLPRDPFAPDPAGSSEPAPPAPQPAPPEPGGAPATPPAKKPTDPDLALIAKLAKAKFDRRPSTLLKDWAKPEGADKPPAETVPAPGAEKPKPQSPEELAIEALQRDVTRGEWHAVGEFFATGFAKPENAAKAYNVLLGALSRVPPRSAPPSKPAPGGSPGRPPQPQPNSQFGEKNLLRPIDILGLADAAPGELDPKDQLPKLGALLRAALARGHFPDTLLEALSAGTAKLGGATDPAKRAAAARLLIAAGLPAEAGDFLPAADASASPDTLKLRTTYHLAMQARGKDAAEHLAAAWDATQSLLAHPEADADERDQALARAVELAPKIEAELGGRWLGDSFAGDAARGREVLATIGALASKGRAERDSSARLRRLALQKTAVDALLATDGFDAGTWAPVLNLLALNWLAEGELSRSRGTSKTLRPQVQWDPFGNMSYQDPRNAPRPPGGSSGNTPQPIATGELLKTRPGDAWLAHADTDLRPKFQSLYAQLFLKVNEPEEAFPHIETLAAGHPEQGKALAEEFLDVWADNHNPNSGRNRTYRYGYQYGYNQRAATIPLTRSKQQRNLAELARWVGKIKGLPIGDIDQAKLAAAFTRVHSSAEVYQADAIQSIFGDFESMSPETVAAFAGTMRSNLATVWRDPRTQQAAKTQRKDKEILAEVAAGYSSAYDIVAAALEHHPEDWRLWLARATLTFDMNNFHQELGNSADYVERRNAAYAMFAKAAAFYAAKLPGDEGDETTEPFEHWFYAGLGASDLGALRETQQSAPAQFDAVKAALEALPSAAADRHMARFANALAARISSVKPELKQRYLRHGLSIVGDHEKATDARKVFDYYADLVTEIQLVARIDGGAAVGHGEPFGVFVDLRHTKAIERESGGFAKYLTNQNNQSYAYNYGRPTQNYREKFEETARAALGEHFDVESVTFHDAKIRSRGTAQEGWRITPYAYFLLQARSPEVDKLPSLQIDLDFLDTSGFVILPVATAPLPIDARAEKPAARDAADVKVTQILDERDAADGKLGLEIKATARGLLPPLEGLLEVAPPGFELVSTEGGELGVVELDGESDEARPVCERRWTLTFEATGDTPETFAFPTPKGEPSEILYQRYDDADLVPAEPVTTLVAGYSTGGGKGWMVAAAIAAIVLLAAFAYFLFVPRRPDQAVAAATRYAVPEEITPFTVISLLRKIRDENHLAGDVHSQLADSIEQLERHYFDRTPGTEPDLKAVAEEWVQRAA